MVLSGFAFVCGRARLADIEVRPLPVRRGWTKDRIVDFNRHHLEPFGMTASTDSEFSALSIRIPVTLRKKLESRAKENLRSLNSEVTVVLRDYFGHDAGKGARLGDIGINL